MKITLTSPARRELIEASTFYAQRSAAELARSFVDALDKAIVLIQQHPQIGSPLLDRYRRLSLNRYPDDVVYRITATEIRRLAIAHQRRQPEYWRSRT